MRKTLLTTVIALVLVGMVSGSAFAGGYGRSERPNRTGSCQIFKNLELTPEQQQKLLAIRQDFQKETQPLRFEIQRKQLELRQLWSAQTLNQSAIETKTKEIAGLRVQMVKKARAMQEKMKSILTAEQRRKWEERLPKHNPDAGRRGRRGCGRRADCFGA
jgi:Spy/CpxP family protein refolding chaperone